MDRPPRIQFAAFSDHRPFALLPCVAGDPSFPPPGKRTAVPNFESRAIPRRLSSLTSRLIGPDGKKHPTVTYLGLVRPPLQLEPGMGDRTESGTCRLGHRKPSAHRVSDNPLAISSFLAVELDCFLHSRLLRRTAALLDRTPCCSVYVMEYRGGRSGAGTNSPMGLMS